MKHLLIMLLGLGMTSFAHAQTAKVIKVKGQQAIVQFPSGAIPQVGQKINLGGGSVADGEGTPMISMGSRKNMIGISASSLYFLSKSTKTNGTTTTTGVNGISLNGRYGWNKGLMEYGPIARFEYESSGSTKTSFYGGGGFFDYNLAPNISGQRLVYAGTADLTVGIQGTSQGSYSSNNTAVSFFGGGSVKWFGLSDSFAIRGDGGLSYESSSQASNSSTTKFGAVIRAGIAAYF